MLVAKCTFYNHNHSLYPTIMGYCLSAELLVCDKAFLGTHTCKECNSSTFIYYSDLSVTSRGEV